MATTITSGALAAGTTTSLAVAYPSGITTNSFLVILGITADSNVVASGFTQVNNGGQVLLSKIASGSESGSVNVTQSASAAIACQMLCVSSPGDLLAIESSLLDNVSSDPQNLKGTTKITPGDVVLTSFGHPAGRTFTTPPSGYTNTGSRTSAASLWVGYKISADNSNIVMDASDIVRGQFLRISVKPGNTLFFGSNF